MKINSLRHLFGIYSLLVASGMIITGCDSMIYDEEGDCSVHYSVPITFTESYDGGNAITDQVRSVTLYVVDSQGNVASIQSAHVPQDATTGFSMAVDVPPGTYDLLVWGQGESPVANPTAYVVSNGSNLTELTAQLPLNGTEEYLYCDRDIVPLFNGFRRNVEFPDTYGEVTLAPVNLIRDTHVFQVLLQTIDGSVLDPEEVTIGIEAANSEISYTNDVISTTTFTYLPWHVSTTSASFDSPDSRADDSVNGVLGELTTGRLMADRAPKLVVRRESDGKDVIRINLIDYLLMVKGEYFRQLTDQQYLDRMRSFTLMFFLDENRNWYTAAGLFINGWRVVIPYEGSL